jgi:predicted phage terminase large subunit-like protein
LAVDDLDLRAALVRKVAVNLLDFVRQFWGYVGAGETFHENWHHVNVCRALERVALEYECVECGQEVHPPQQVCGCGGKTKRKHTALVINQPPSTTKTLIVSVFWPAWLWTIDPQHRWMYVSYDEDVVRQAADRMLSVLKSDLYQACWPATQLVGGVTSKQALSFFQTTAGGERHSKSFQGGLTGKHADTLVIDDPIKPEDAVAPSGLELARVERIYGSTLRSRRRNPMRFAEVCIMQRLADGDLSSYLLNLGAEHLMYPMSYVPGAGWDAGNTLGLEDPRTEPGELLWPDRYTPEIIERDQAGMTPAVAEAQYQQNPTPESGSYFEAAWFREYIDLPRDWQLEFFQSWDLGFKGRDRGSRQVAEARSRTHGALWAMHKTEGKLYLIDEVLGRWNYPEARQQFLEAQLRHPWSRSTVALVEDKAMGSGLISELQEDVPIIYGWDPEGSKEDRARRHSQKVEAGIVYLPKAPWAQEFLAELVRFPRQRENDRVDTTTMLLDWLYRPGGRAGARLRGLVEFFKRP